MSSYDLPNWHTKVSNDNSGIRCTKSRERKLCFRTWMLGRPHPVRCQILSDSSAMLPKKNDDRAWKVRHFMQMLRDVEEEGSGLLKIMTVRVYKRYTLGLYGLENQALGFGKNARDEFPICMILGKFKRTVRTFLLVGAFGELTVLLSEKAMAFAIDIALFALVDHEMKKALGGSGVNTNTAPGCAVFLGHRGDRPLTGSSYPMYSEKDFFSRLRK
ncbi:hypothetical protein CPB84DRAFT_1749485 [Gymnopilus junonius]|uniref:Uncharacterized protein n=1 Tax=Gymnopilus junonius TaxID=109634 RepID=A0A9P5TKG3_GYMJU|nr:hypothetical protein CPB84DRAFT_1749485 [Gymnopilus junonius]